MGNAGGTHLFDEPPLLHPRAWAPTRPPAIFLGLGQVQANRLVYDYEAKGFSYSPCVRAKCTRTGDVGSATRRRSNGFFGGAALAHASRGAAYIVCVAFSPDKAPAR